MIMRMEEKGLIAKRGKWRWKIQKIKYQPAKHRANMDLKRKRKRLKVKVKMKKRKA